MKSVLSAVGVLAVALIGAAPANAAWTCSGPELACAGKSVAKKASVASTKAVYKAPKAAFRTVAYKAKRQGSKSAKTSSKSKSVSYSGGGSRGMASYYWQPQALASGGRFNPHALTAAHKTLPFGTRVRVTNLNNGRSVVVVINDRGPYIKGRVIDLSLRAAQVVGMTGSGVAPVSYSIMGRG